MTHENATPRPWSTGPSHTVGRTYEDDQGRRCKGWVAECVLCGGIEGDPLEQRDANAALIVKAVNSYDAAQAMAEAMEGLILAELGSRDKAKAALSAFRKATGEGK